MIIFYSGEGSNANPENVLLDDANLMLTFHDFHKNNRPNKRFYAILKERRKKRRKHASKKGKASSAT